ncbi:MAG: ABC transporter permease [Flavobacteriales bacterium]|nr:ABC transporter permease [Flavobacteriales bacterium]MCB9447496.1 ABC transporter permease [Flavobacteriales bacterium]
MVRKLAWRNLWRNRRRSVITLVSVALAVILSSLMMSIKNGVYANMIESLMGSFTGYIQLHAKGYWEEKNLDESLELTDSLKASLNNRNELNGFLPRIETGVLAASGNQTKFSMLVGMDPEAEDRNAHLSERVSTGSYLTPDDKAVLVGAGLAEYLKLDAGDTIVLLSQGYHGSNAAGKYPVKGIIHFGSPELSKQLVILPLKEAQWLLDMPERMTSLILIPKKPGHADVIASHLNESAGPGYEVLSWQTMNPSLVRMMATDKVEGYVFMSVLYLIISFGLFGTMLMMLAERRHEFGVLVAMGMRRGMLARMVWIELCMLSLLGAVIGIAGAFPVCAWFHYHPISLGDQLKDMVEEYGMEAVMQASMNPLIFAGQAVVVLIVATIIACYPLVKLQWLNAIKSMRA